jgi:ribA/ribD-fused uncharacterized protein
MKIFFLKIADPYGCFSNFSKHPIIVDEKEYKTIEAYYQSRKYNDPELQERVRLSISPWVAAQIGRDPSLPLRKDWEEVKEKVMKEALLYKVSQHPDIRSTLLSTENNEIIEHTPRDHYWADGGDGSGKNRLGILWMEIRNELKSIND